MMCPKTGSTSMRKFLKENYNAYEWEYQLPKHPRLPKDYNINIHEAGDKEIRFPNNTLLVNEHISHLPKQFQDYFIFSVVRNPFHLSVSRWEFFYKHKALIPIGEKSKSFSQYIKGVKHLTIWEMLHQRENYIPPEGYVKYKLDAYLKIENLEKEFSTKLPFARNNNKIPKLNQKGNNLLGYYTPELVEEVRTKLADDFENFNYSLECPKELLYKGFKIYL